METMTATQMASLYGLPSSIAFNKLLTRCGLLTHTDKGYVLASDYQGQDLTTTVTAWYWLPSGVKASKKKAAWTVKGQQVIRQRLGRLGILPPSEQLTLFAS